MKRNVFIPNLFESEAVVVVAVVKPNPLAVVVVFPIRGVDRFVENPPNVGTEDCAVVVVPAPNVNPGAAL